jgi:exodeoxyribonuclease VII large subunit
MITSRAQELQLLVDRGRDGVDRRLDAGGRQLGELRATLRALAPGATLARGYAIAHLGDGTIVRSAGQAPGGADLTVTVEHGSFGAVSTGEVPESGAP